MTVPAAGSGCSVPGPRRPGSEAGHVTERWARHTFVCINFEVQPNQRCFVFDQMNASKSVLMTSRQTPNQSQKMEDIRIFEEWLRESNRALLWSRRFHEGISITQRIRLRFAADRISVAAFIIFMFGYFGWNSWKLVCLYNSAQVLIAFLLNER